MVLNGGEHGEMWIGGAPQGTNVTAQSMTGCIHELFVNEMKVGLWNFKKEFNRCDGCLEGYLS
jgi:hypothetical protein